MLTLAALVFMFQVVRQRRAGQLSASSFSTVLLVVMIGWMATEVVSDAAGVALGELGRVTHFAVMVLFAATITLQLRRSSGK
jgi:uncharacterized membrane protein YwaF